MLCPSPLPVRPPIQWWLYPLAHRPLLHPVWSPSWVTSATIWMRHPHPGFSALGLLISSHLLSAPCRGLAQTSQSMVQGLAVPGWFRRLDKIGQLSSSTESHFWRKSPANLHFNTLPRWFLGKVTLRSTVLNLVLVNPIPQFNLMTRKSHSLTRISYLSRYFSQLFPLQLLLI